MKKVLVISLVIAFIAIIFGISYWYTSQEETAIPEELTPQNFEEDYERAESLIEAGKPLAAIDIIRKYRANIEQKTGQGDQWLELLVRASAEIPDIQQLIILYQFRPESFNNNEQASLMLGEAFLLGGRTQDFEVIREKWKGRETKTKDWLAVDSDHLILEGEREQAIELLKSAKLEGKDDAERLLRLSLLHLNQNPKVSWLYLVEANKVDPGNPTILSYRARLLEATGQSKLALSEYIAASAADPDNLGYRDQIAEFFMRNKQYHRAVLVYEEAFQNLEPIDNVLLKAVFLGKVIEPFDVEVTSDFIPEGRVKRLIEYINALPQYTFWDEEKFEEIPNYQKYLESEQITWWLRLLSALKTNDIEEAKDLLEHNQFKEVAWSPDLTLIIKRIIRYKENQSFNLDNTPLQATPLEERTIGRDDETAIGFFRQINDIALEEEKNTDATIPEYLHDLLSSPFAFSAALLAIGWDEAALATKPAKVVPEEFPEWVAYAYTKAIGKNKGQLKALEFATQQKQSPAIQLLIAEIMLTQNNRDAAVDILQKLSEVKGTVGMRASWLLSIIYVRQKEYEKAKETVKANQELMDNYLGVEALARIALLTGDMNTADSLYKSIEEQSSEAKSYLARQAFHEKNWTRARELTIELLKEFPNSIILRQNLMKVINSQKEGNTEEPEPVEQTNEK